MRASSLGLHGLALGIGAVRGAVASRASASRRAACSSAADTLPRRLLLGGLHRCVGGALGQHEGPLRPPSPRTRVGAVLGRLGGPALGLHATTLGRLGPTRMSATCASEPWTPSFTCSMNSSTSWVLYPFACASRNAALSSSSDRHVHAVDSTQRS